ncbi:MAG: zinc finger CCCH domain-containing protein [Deltaproteobacteria bacterium]|nr:zinc finger CCCH domain-containing protein [Deltaproteobacteria bacterium]
MIKTAIRFLECVCGRRTIATSGYREGLMILEANRRIFEEESRRNPAFMMSFLCMLDREFQNFLTEVVAVAGLDDPIGALISANKQSMMEDEIYNLLSPWLHHSVVSTFRPPADLEWMVSSSSHQTGIREIDDGARNRARLSQGTDASAGNGGRRGQGGGRLTGSSTTPGRDPDWWFSIPDEELVREWSLPRGKKFGEYFNTSKKENSDGLPFFKHHKKPGKTAQICMKHQLGTCNKGGNCSFAHIRPRDIPSEKFQIISTKLRSVFGPGSSSGN